MATLWVDGLFFAGVVLLPVGAGMIVVGGYTRTFRAVLVGVGLLLAAAVILLAGP